MNGAKKRIFLLMVVFGFYAVCSAAQESYALPEKSPDTKISITQQIKEKACALKEVIKNNGGKIVLATLGCLLAGAWFMRGENGEGEIVFGDDDDGGRGVEIYQEVRVGAGERTIGVRARVELVPLRREALEATRERGRQILPEIIQRLAEDQQPHDIRHHFLERGIVIRRMSKSRRLLMELGFSIEMDNGDYMWGEEDRL